MTANTWHWKGARWIYAYVVFVIFNVALVFSPEVQKSASGHGLIIAFIFFFRSIVQKPTSIKTERF